MNGAVVDGLLVNYAAGSSVEYKCHQYYLLKGEERSHCQHGQWSAPPVCLGKTENALNVLQKLSPALRRQLTYNLASEEGVQV